MILHRRAFCLSVFFLLWGVVSLADDWPQWLGPQRDGVWREGGILRRFPPEGPRVLWRRKLGGGYCGPAVVAGRVYVMDRLRKPDDPGTLAKLARDFGKATNHHYERGITLGYERILCLDASDGSLLWQYSYDCPYTVAVEYANGPRATPAVHEEKVYAVGAEGDFTCLDSQTGRVVWKRDWKADYALKVPIWGVSTQPLVDGEKVICVIGGDGTTAVAFQKDTGKELWRSLSSQDPGYSAPVIHTVGTTRQLIVWHGEAVNGLDPESGDVYWSVPVKTWSGMAIATPRYVDGLLFVTGFQHQSTLIRLGLSQPTAEVVWRGDASVGVESTLTTPSIVDGYVYAGGRNGRYVCVRLEDGERVWKTYAPSTGDRRASWASVFTIRHEDRFLLVNDSGDLIIAELSPDGYEEVSRTHIIDPKTPLGRRTVVWSHPAFANRCVYARSDDEIVCVSLASDQ